MATKKLTDYLSASLPLSGGGFTMARTTPSNTYAAPTPTPVAPVAPVAASTAVPPVTVPTPPTTPPAPGSTLFAGTTQTSATGATGATGSSIPPQYLNADGSFKTPDQVASDVAGTLKAAHGNGDVGTLALDQFGGAKSSVQLEADARRVGNARNDISVGETDPYKVASQSGIAYTPAELQAIEKAYAGVYDPALDTALAKVTNQQNIDKTKAESDARIAEQKAAPYTLSPTDIRYDGQGNVVSRGSLATSAGGVYVKGENPTVDSYIIGRQNGTYQPGDIPDLYKNLVAQGLAAATGSNAPLSKTSTDALGIINQLKTLDVGALSGTGLIGSVEHPSSLFPGTNVQNTQNLAKQLQATISLANRQQLKGSGAISDFEFRVLGDAATALGLDANGRTNLSGDDFKKQLANLQLKLEVGPTKLTDDELQYLHDVKGYSTDEIRKYIGEHEPSFSSVGNTSDSTLATGKGNIPQRNNNPGDIKAGSQADALAVGKDQFGHLIFPDAATGFQALENDLTAKMKGTGRLPANPTIAELGAVYAEDPNWPKRVAEIIGVPIDTHTATIPIDKLVRAVATQEGFYA